MLGIWKILIITQRTEKQSFLIFYKLYLNLVKILTMNAAKANLINSISLIVFGLWGYFEVTSPTALIPVGFGVVLLLCYSGVKNQNKVIAHIAVLLTLVILLALVGMRLPKSLESGGIGLFRVVAMCLTSVLAMIYFVRSFIEARRK